MAFLQTIRNLLIPSASRGVTVVEPSAPDTTYAVQPLKVEHLDEVLRLNYRCFENGENYTKHTFSYLLSQPNALCYQSVTEEGRMAGFLCVLIGTDGTGHVTTVGVAPEHRRRGIAEALLEKLEEDLSERGIASIVLEVRVGNLPAQALYAACGFSIVQRLTSYYNNGEDGFLMVKSLA